MTVSELWRRGIHFGDGTHDYVYTINGQFPGPNIVVYEGQEVRIRVRNLLLHEGMIKL